MLAGMADSNEESCRNLMINEGEKERGGCGDGGFYRRPCLRRGLGFRAQSDSCGRRHTRAGLLPEEEDD
jgi:hypothetical protein